MMALNNIYLKKRLFKFLSEYPVLKEPTLPSSFSRKYFRLIKKVCNENVGIFGKKAQKCGTYTTSPLTTLFEVI